MFFLNEKRRLANLMKSMYAVLFDCIYSIPIRVGILWLVFLVINVGEYTIYGSDVS